MSAATTRAIANNMFLQRLPQRAAQGNLLWRKGIILDLCELTGCSIAAASTHYNYAFKRIKESEPELVQGLGRPEGKNNGGRKRKQVPPVAAPLLLLGYTPASPVDALCGDLGEQQQVFEVRRCKDSVAIHTGLMYEEARAKVERAAQQKKGKLYWV